MKNPLQQQFEEIAQDLIKQKALTIKLCYASSTKITAIKELKEELKVLKEAYAVILEDADTLDVDYSVVNLLK